MLSGADLSDADLRGVDFSLANITKVLGNLTFFEVCGLHNVFVLVDRFFY